VNQDLERRADDGKDQPGAKEAIGHGSGNLPDRSKQRGVPTAAERIVRLAYWLAVAAVAVQTASHVANVAIWDGDVFALDADAEENAFAWAGSAMTFAAALMVFLPAVSARTVDRAGLVLAAAIAFFSLDDAVSLHERVGAKSVEALGVSVSLDRLMWPVVYMPLFALVFLLLWRVAHRGPAVIRRPILTGLGLLIAAVVLEVSSALYLSAEQEKTWPDTIEVVLEEGAELGGWILIAGALAARVYVRAQEELR